MTTQRGTMSTGSGVLLILLAAGCLLVVAPAEAQNRNAGEIRGTITDVSGAVIPGAKIAIQNTLTGVTTNLVSDSHGVYDAASLVPGTYSVTFTMHGFKTLVKSNIVLHVEAITVDARLEVGAVTQQVNVTTGAPLVQTETSAKQLTLTSSTVTQLPTVGRTWYDFTGLLPGANPGANSTWSMGGTPAGEGGSVNGQGGFQESWQVDGGNATIEHSQNPDLLEVPIDAIGEIDLKTNNFDAEYSSGLAVFSVITKGGTNQFHGSLFEFNQNDKYDAATYFQDATNTLKPPLRWNMFGGSVGGPIKKDKAFFFFSFQRNPISAFSTPFYTYPTTAMRNGDFSATEFPTIYDPATTTQLANGTYTRVPFSNNLIPSSKFDPAAVKILSHMPMPNLPGAGIVNNYFADLYSPTTTTYYNARGDYNFSSGNRLSVSTMQVYQSTGSSTPTPPIDEVPDTIHEFTWQASDVWSINPNTVNEFHASMAREYGNWTPLELGKGWSQQLGIPNLTYDLFPAITMSGVGAPSGIGTSFKVAVLGFTTYTPASDTLTLIRGKHILKFGGEFNEDRDNFCWSCWAPGSFNFSGIFTTNPTSPAGTGMGYADFLLGLPNSWTDTWTPTDGGRQHNFQAFAEDDFKVTPKLTLNLGLRWLVQGGWTEAYNRLGSFDPALTNPATGTPGAMWFGGQDGRTALEATAWHDLQPRVGFAWAPKPSWSIRGGYGIYYEMVGTNYYQSGLGDGIAVSGSQVASNDLTPFMQLHNGHTPPATPTFPPSPAFYNGTGVTFVPYNTPLEYVQQWQLAIQHQLGSSAMVEVGYTGSRTVHMPDPSDFNALSASAIAANGKIGVNLQPYRPYPQFQGITISSVGGWGDYNSLQVNFTKNMSHGLWLTSHYTWSHSLDTSTMNGWAGFSGLLQIPLDPAANYGNADVNVPNNWNGGLIYQLPFGAGKALLNKAGLLNDVVGGWQLSNTWQVESGLPFYVTWAGGPNLDFAEPANGGTWLANRVCNGNISNPTVEKWFNTSCFVQPAQATFGDSGRNILTGPGFANMDTSLAKSFPLSFLGEQGRLEFRIDVDDVLNHPNFGPVSGCTGAPGCGTINSVLTNWGNRTAQIGARLSF
jgi:hypothetical protein